MSDILLPRRQLIARAGGLVAAAGTLPLLSGCDAINDAPAVRKILAMGEEMNRASQRALIERGALAREQARRRDRRRQTVARAGRRERINSSLRRSVFVRAAVRHRRVGARRRRGAALPCGRDAGYLAAVEVGDQLAARCRSTANQAQAERYEAA